MKSDINYLCHLSNINTFYPIFITIKNDYRNVPLRNNNTSQ